LIWFTSDLHFCHHNILSYEPDSRPFNTIEEMNETLVQKWNENVSAEDTVYVLGDLSMGRVEVAIEYIKRLNGKIILIRGNHDTPKRVEAYKEIGIEVHDIFYLPYKGRYFILCHFPIANEEFIRMVIEDNSEVVNLYGHVHSNAPVGYKDGTYHVGVDTNRLAPISIEQIWNECWPEKQMKQPEVKAYHDAHVNGTYDWDL
jgi:calcineurin-like phosphoesterase family protein